MRLRGSNALTLLLALTCSLLVAQAACMQISPSATLAFQQQRDISEHWTDTQHLVNRLVLKLQKSPTWASNLGIKKGPQMLEHLKTDPLGALICDALSGHRRDIYTGLRLLGFDFDVPLTHTVLADPDSFGNITADLLLLTDDLFNPETRALLLVIIIFSGLFDWSRWIGVVYFAADIPGFLASVTAGNMILQSTAVNTAAGISDPPRGWWCLTLSQRLGKLDIPFQTHLPVAAAAAAAAGMPSGWYLVQLQLLMTLTRLVKHYLLRDLNQLGVDPSEFIRLDVYLLSVYNLIIQRPDGSSGMLDISLSSGEGTLPADARRLKELLAGDFFLRPVNPDEASNNIFQVAPQQQPRLRQLDEALPSQGGIQVRYVVAAAAEEAEPGGGGSQKRRKTRSKALPVEQQQQQQQQMPPATAGTFYAEIASRVGGLVSSCVLRKGATRLSSLHELRADYCEAADISLKRAPDMYKDDNFSFMVDGGWEKLTTFLQRPEYRLLRPAQQHKAGQGRRAAPEFTDSD